MRSLLWISILCVLGCNRGQSTADSGAAPPATATPATATTTAPPPTDTAVPPLGGTAKPTAYPTPARLPDGGLAPAPEGGAFVMPTFTVPSNFTMPSGLPSGFPTALPSGFPTFPPPPAPTPSK